VALADINRAGSKRARMERRKRGVRGERMEQIARAAAAVFSSRGYDRGTLEEIARAVGITRAALYNYYPSKRQLLKSILSGVICMATEILSRNCESISDPVERAEAVISQFIELISREPNLASLYFQQTEAVLRAAGPELRELEANYLARFTEVVSAGLAARGWTNFDSATIGYAIFGMCVWTYRWLGSRVERDPAIVGRELATMILKSPPGAMFLPTDVAAGFSASEGNQQEGY
jgi:AcrR family transcriptional regulator